MSKRQVGNWHQHNGSMANLTLESTVREVLMAGAGADYYTDEQVDAVAVMYRDILSQMLSNHGIGLAGDQFYADDTISREDVDVIVADALNQIDFWSIVESVEGGEEE